MKNKLLLSLLMFVLLAGACSPAPAAIPQPTLTRQPTSNLEMPPELSFDGFLEDANRQILLRDPEGVSELALAEVLGTGNDQLTNISDAYIRQTQQMEIDLLAQLHAYDRAALKPEQQISYDALEWYLNDRIAGHAFMYNDYPASFFLMSVNSDLTLFLTDLHPVANMQDAQDFITRLSQVDTKFEQLLDGLRRRQELGVIPPDYILNISVDDLGWVESTPARQTPFFTSFEKKVNALTDLTADEKTALLDAAEQEITNTVLPAYQSLRQFLKQQTSLADSRDGAWKLPDGDAYYAYLLRHYTTTNLTAEEIHQMGLQEVERLQTEIRQKAAALGLAEDASMTEIFSAVSQQAGAIPGPKVKQNQENLIAYAESLLPQAFDLIPKAKVIVIGGETGGYYVAGSWDGSRPGAFYAYTAGPVWRYRQPSVTFHETIPGHHTQISIMQELDLPMFRRWLTFDGFVEGWALYAERLMAELGAYQDDPYGEMGYLQYQLMRAVRMVVDTGIHGKHWTYQQGLDYFLENTGLSQGTAEGEVVRYVVYPGQAPAYMVGELKILELRQRAEEQLGDKFDLKEFHHIVLENGSLPLELLEQQVDLWIAGK